MLTICYVSHFLYLAFYHVVFARYDCGFFGILFMEYFTGKVMPDFNNITIPHLRRMLAASLIDNRDNQEDDIEEIMNEDLQKG